MASRTLQRGLASVFASLLLVCASGETIASSRETGGSGGVAGCPQDPQRLCYNAGLMPGKLELTVEPHCSGTTMVRWNCRPDDITKCLDGWAVLAPGGAKKRLITNLAAGSQIWITPGKPPNATDQAYVTWTWIDMNDSPHCAPPP
jgi:hypothetical protein